MLPTPQFQTLLVPLDGSRMAESVLPTVECLARHFGSHVTLLHILEQKPPPTIHGERHLAQVAEAEAYLAGVAGRLQEASIPVTLHTHASREGDVARSIAGHADELRADLVVLCTHGSGGMRGLLFGRIAQQVLQHGQHPVLLLPPGQQVACGLDLHHVLAPLDGTPRHEPALPVAAALATAFGARLHLALVIPTVAALSGASAATALLLPGTMRAVLDLAEHGAIDYLNQVVARCRQAGADVTAQVLRGDPAPVVLEQAERLNADLIVMASHGRAGLDALFAGSVAPRITSRANRPLLLVRANVESDNKT